MRKKNVTLGGIIFSDIQYSRQLHCKQFSKRVLMNALMLTSALPNAYLCVLNKIINLKAIRLIIC